MLERQRASAGCDDERVEGTPLAPRCAIGERLAGAQRASARSCSGLSAWKDCETRSVSSPCCQVLPDVGPSYLTVQIYQRHDHRMVRRTRKRAMHVGAGPGERHTRTERDHTLKASFPHVARRLQAFEAAPQGDLVATTRPTEQILCRRT